MPGPRAVRLVEAVLCCYPARWRRRHGEEAAELAALLMRDGTPAGSIAWSYLKGAARERLTPRPSRRLGTVLGTLVVAAASLGVSLGLVSASVPARAASTPSTASTSSAARAAPVARAHCRPGPAEPVQNRILSSAGTRVRIWEAETGHDQSC